MTLAAATRDAATHFQSGRLDEAVAAATRAIEADGRDLEAYHIRALALGRLGRMQAAAQDFRTAAAGHPQAADILCNLGNAWRRAGEPVEAAQAYGEALKVDPNNRNALFGRALAHDEAGDGEAAEADLNAILKTTPSDPGALNALGLRRLASGDEAEAERCFDRALSARPDFAPALVNRGLLKGRDGRAEEGLADLEAACRAEPASAAAQQGRANALRSAGRNDEAMQAFFAAFKLAPRDPDLHGDYARFRWELGDGPGFLSVLDAALAQSADADLFLLKSKLALRAGLLDVALEAADQATAAAPERADAVAARGELRMRAGEGEAGLADLERAHRARPGDFDIRHDYAEALLSVSKFQAAADILAGDAPDEHVQRHAALQSLALRGLGDPDYERICDFDAFIGEQLIRTPDGWDTLEAFNADLAEAILDLHETSTHPLDQTLYNGTQSPGRLWNAPARPIQALKTVLMEAAEAYVAGLPDDPDHPFLRRKTDTLELAGAWSVRLFSGGGHVDHMHPAGWISASYYVAIPDEVNETGKAGWIRFGASGVRGLDMPAEKWVRPRPGLAVFFPSFFWHGVESFTSDQPRITAPFDLRPVA